MNSLSAHKVKQSKLAHAVLFAAALLMCGALHEPANGATLQSLVNGGSLNVGNSIFSDWQVLHLDSTSGVNPDFALIDVTPLVGDPLNPGVQFTTSSQLSIAGINAIDLIVQYRVASPSGSNSFTGHTLSLTGMTATNGGIATIANESASLLGADLGPTVVIDDNQSGVSQLTSISSFSPQAGLLTTANLFITGSASTSSVNLTSFTQRFAQNGPPLLAGDYNHDGTTDAADYVVWRKAGGPTHGYNTWRTNYGQKSFGSSRVIGASSAVPEPSMLVLVIGSLFNLCSLKRLRWGRRSYLGYPHSSKDRLHS
jgi:hypothetical protein